MCYWCRNNAYCQAKEKALYKAVNDGVMYCVSFNPVSLPELSFGMTTASFVNKAKGVTRRHWAQATIKRFKKDTYFLAWSKQKRFGGEAIGIGKMTDNPYREKTGVHLLDGQKSILEFYQAEGFEFLDNRYLNIKGNPIIGMDSYEGKPLLKKTIQWLNNDEPMIVVPFEIIEVFPNCKEKYSTDEEIVRCVKALVRELP